MHDNAPDRMSDRTVSFVFNGQLHEVTIPACYGGGDVYIEWDRVLRGFRVAVDECRDTLERFIGSSVLTEPPPPVVVQCSGYVDSWPETGPGPDPAHLRRPHSRVPPATITRPARCSLRSTLRHRERETQWAS